MATPLYKKAPLVTEEIPRYKKAPLESDFNINIKSLKTKHDNVRKEARTFWQTISNSLVGEEAEWSEYWNRGLGQSNISLMSQYYFNKEIGYGWEKAFTEEPEDTGILERLLETGVALIGDIPTFAVGAVPAGLVTGGNPFAIGFSGGFLNQAFKTTYLKALQRGDVDSFKEWWDIFIKEGVAEGTTTGLQLGASLAFPGLLGAKGLIASAVTQTVGFEAMGFALTGELPTKETLINDALLFGIMNVGVRGKQKLAEEQVRKNFKNSYETITQMVKNPAFFKDTISNNLKKWRNKNLPDETPKPFNKKEIDQAKLDNLDFFSGEHSAKKWKDTTIDNMTALSEGFHLHFIDKLFPIKKVVKELFDKKTSKLNPYELFRNLPASIEKAFYWAEKNPYNIFTGEYYDSKALKNIFSFIKNQEQYDNFKLYRGGKRALELKKRGILIETEKGKPFDYEQAQKDIKRLEDPAFKKQYEIANKELDKFYKAQLDLLEDSGLITKEIRKVVEEMNKDYFPFSKLREGFDIGGPSATRMRSPLKKIGKKLRGKFEDPIEQTYRNTAFFVEMAERNKALQAFFNMIDENPALAKELGIQKAEKVTSAFEVTTKELSDIFNVSEDLLKKGGVENFSIFRKNSFVNGNQISVFRKGKKETYTVPKELIDPLTGTNNFSALFNNSFMKGLALPTKGLRLGVILDPVYWAKNLFRDTWFSAVVSRNGFAVPTVRTFQGLWTMIRAKVGNKKAQSVLDDFMRSGALQSTFIQFGKYGDDAIRKQLVGRTLDNQINPNPLNRFVELLRAGAEGSEITTKLGEFLYVKKNLEKLNLKLDKNGKLTKQEILERAGFEARDLFDFAKQGYIAEGVNSLNAFYTSGIRGYDKLFDALKNRPGQTLLKSALYITAPSIYFWYGNHDDPLYQRLPQWRKDLFWNIPINKGKTQELYKKYLKIYRNPDGTPDTDRAFRQAAIESEQYFLTIPKPFELGLLFGASIERTLDHIYGTNPDVTNNLLLDGLSNMATTFNPLQVDLLRPFGEIYFNKSIFTGRPIIPESLKNDDYPEYETGLYTSEFAKQLSSIVGDIRLLKYFKSPIKVDYIYDSWTGGLGKSFKDFFSFTAEKLGFVEAPIKPFSSNWIKNIDKLPVIKAFVIRQPGMSSVHIEKFYQNWNKFRNLDRAFNAAQAIQNETERQEAMNKLTQEPDYGLYEIYKEFAGIIRTQKEMIELTQLMYDINPDKNLEKIILDTEKTLENATPERILEIIKSQYNFTTEVEDKHMLVLIRDTMSGGNFLSKFFPTQNELTEKLDQLYTLMIETAKEANKVARNLQGGRKELELE